MMETCVEFQADCFPAYATEDQEVNPGRFGKRLAEFLVQGLRTMGIECCDPEAEDWGWLITIQRVEFPLQIHCANYDEYPNGFACFIEPHQPVVRKLLRTIDTTVRVNQLREAMDRLLSEKAGIKNKCWKTYKQFNS